jgi:hypothetical protein
MIRSREGRSAADQLGRCQPLSQTKREEAMIVLATVLDYNVGIPPEIRSLILRVI